MAIFCSKCGTVNEDGAGFCDNCGAKLRTPSKSSADVESTPPSSTDIPTTRVQGKAGTINPKKLAYVGVALAALLVVGSGAMYFVLQPPAATASTLLAAAKAGYGKTTTDRFKAELCIANIDYSKSTFNAGANDSRTLAWMDVLVKADLFSAPVEISSGGYFAQTLLQYVATPELEKYRQGSKLCAAKDVEISGVTDIGNPEEQALGSNGGPPKVLAVAAKLNLKSLDTAPWMEKPEVREAVMTTIDGWQYKEKSLQKQVNDVFGLKDNKWTTGTAYKTALEGQYKNAQPGNKSNDKEDSSTSAKSSGGFLAKLSSLFAFGHPLKGTWQMAAQDTGFGGKISAGLGPDLTFTSDAMESMGQSTKADFSVDGKRVLVTPKGQNQSLIFVMESQDIMVMQNPILGGMRYERIKK